MHTWTVTFACRLPAPPDKPHSRRVYFTSYDVQARTIQGSLAAATQLITEDPKHTGARHEPVYAMIHNFHG
jgi:hypothetical protein